METNNTATETLCWETWNADGDRRLKTSKTHAISADDDGRTLCGLAIPDHGEGIVHEDPNLGDGDCARCEKAIERLEEELADDDDETIEWGMADEATATSCTHTKWSVRKTLWHGDLEACDDCGEWRDEDLARSRGWTG